MARITIESQGSEGRGDRGENEVAARTRETANLVQQLPKEVVASFALPDAKARALRLEERRNEILVGVQPLLSWIERRRPPGTADPVIRRLYDVTAEAVACAGSDIPQYAGGKISRPTGPLSPGVKRTATLVVMALLVADQLRDWAGDIEVEEGPETRAGRTVGGVSGKRENGPLTPRESRDKWIYGECRRGTPYQTIANRLKKKPKKWPLIESVNGIKRAAERYAERHSLAKPPARQCGRPPS